VTFGIGLGDIGFEAFADCTSLANVCFSGKAPVDGGSIFFDDFSLGGIDYVSTASGWGPTYDDILTTPVSTCGGTPPQLIINLAGTNVVVAWPDTFSGYTLQSTSNLDSPAVWSNVSPAPVIINSYYVVTNAIVGSPKFYRLVGLP
jgi:hypothetical protein